VDLAVSQNGAETKLYRNISASPGIRLKERVPVGSRVRVKYSDGSYGPIREIQAGSGYWSQNGSGLIGLRNGAETVEAIASDGTVTDQPISEHNR
jgi:hypothetical protein